MLTAGPALRYDSERHRLQPRHSLPSNIALLIATAAAAPVIPYGFSKPFFPSIRDDGSQGTNPNLFSNPIPFLNPWKQDIRRKVRSPFQAISRS
jgi:hypothetical protein